MLILEHLLNRSELIIWHSKDFAFFKIDSSISSVIIRIVCKFTIAIIVWQNHSIVARLKSCKIIIVITKAWSFFVLCEHLLWNKFFIDYISEWNSVKLDMNFARVEMLSHDHVNILFHSLRNFIINYHIHISCIEHFVFNFLRIFRNKKAKKIRWKQ